MPFDSKRLADVSCACGRVHFEAERAPIGSVVCYCDDCQAGSLALAALPDAPPVCDEDGGTGYVLYRKDRVRCTLGSELLVDHKLNAQSATSRVVATCCNSAMMMRFDDVRHWTSIYRGRFGNDAPSLRWRICTKFKRDGVTIPTDVAVSQMYPMGFMARLLASGVATLLRI
ncbi:GFA family protein [Devosia sp. A449]